MSYDESDVFINQFTVNLYREMCRVGMSDKIIGWIALRMLKLVWAKHKDKASYADGIMRAAEGMHKIVFNQEEEVHEKEKIIYVDTVPEVEQGFDWDMLLQNKEGNGNDKNNA